MSNVDELRRQLEPILGRVTNNFVLDQLSHFLIECLEKGTSVFDAETQLEQSPTLKSMRNLISFKGAKVADGVSIGDVAEGNYAKLEITDKSSLVSLDHATMQSGVNIGDVAGENLVKIQFQQGIFITISITHPFDDINKQGEDSAQFNRLEFDNCYLISIGINEYRLQSQLSNLLYAQSDAQSLYKVLQKKGCKEENCQLLLGAEATTQAIHNSLKSLLLSKPGKKDLVIIFFAGYCLSATREGDKRNGESENEVFLVTSDFDRERMKERGERLEYPLALENLSRRFFEKAISAELLFIVDGYCSPELDKSIIDNKESAWQEKAYSLSNTIVNTFSGTNGREVIANCHYVSKNNNLSRSRFSLHLQDALQGKTQWAVRRDGWMTASTLFEHLNMLLEQNVLKGGNPSSSGVRGLFYYPHLSMRDIKLDTRLVRLKSLLATPAHDRFMTYCLKNFIEREPELQAIYQHIEDLRPTGGYVIISGMAGQGTSSLISSLINRSKSRLIVHHFIPPQDHEPNYRIELLRDLMAQLILKHDLEHWYLDDSAVLENNFLKLLETLSKKNIQELIVIDGLHQIGENFDGRRNLSFLPSHFSLPPHVVFIIGTRPNDVLRALKPHRKCRVYEVPMLNSDGFEQMLKCYGVTPLEQELRGAIYTILHGNTLYLKLAAQEMAKRGLPASPEELLSWLPNNPSDIFSLQIESLKNRSKLWRGVIRPMLVLLADQRSLSKEQIKRHLQEKVGATVDFEDLNAGLEKLGGLIREEMPGWYTMGHPKLRDYLQKDLQLVTGELPEDV